ncbi:MAG: hypothetical protein JOZ62_02680 [Acidobacteriaceae bacterium]|nr:hypothetical protein [Acidobacteriaceae bacterium]
MSLLTILGALLGSFAAAQQAGGHAGPSTAATTSQASSREDSSPATAPPITFESHGMEYEALTKDGITVMFAPLPPHVKDFNIVQVTVTNGSLVSWTVRPTDFTFVRHDGTTLPAISADEVVSSLLERAGRNDVIKLQLLYEDTIYALSNYRSTNGYEQRREAAMAQFVNARFKAAAAASAITLAPTKLKPGDSTDGAVFFENRTKGKTLGPGRLIAHTCGQHFIFDVYAEPKLR